MRLLIEHATVWDGSGAAPFAGQVLIEGERIVAVAPSAQIIAAAEGADRLDAGDKFLMPGLVEGHAHLSFVDTLRGSACARAATPSSSTSRATTAPSRRGPRPRS